MARRARPSRLTSPRDDTAAAAVCLDGSRDGPPEDCGGRCGYELISVAIDPLDPDHSDAVLEFERMYGIEFHADGIGLNPFRIDVIDAELAKRVQPGARPERGTEHRRSGFRPRCREHRAGRKQANPSARR